MLRATRLIANLLLTDSCRRRYFVVDRPSGCWPRRQSMAIACIQATSVVVRPAVDIPPQMLFTDYRDEKGDVL